MTEQKEYIERDIAIEKVNALRTRKGIAYALSRIPAANVAEIPAGGIKDLSDGYHTFRSLYEQRLILSAALVRARKEIAWKSKLHADGEKPFGGGHFVVGFSTPDGEYTYHYKLEYWDLFDCQELPFAKPWDGHTDKDVRRLLSISESDVR